MLARQQRRELSLDLPVLDDVLAAREAIRPYVHRTRTIRSNTLSERLGTNVYVKLEMFQKTGAFKVRGAFNRMLAMSPSERRSGVVAVSAGNHGQAVAFAARELGMRAVVLMPESTPRHYAEAITGYGATIVYTPTLADALRLAPRYGSVWRRPPRPSGARDTLDSNLFPREIPTAEGGRRHTDATYVHPFADRLVIAGQGTLGLEILDDVPQVTDVLVSIGGGGLAGGVSLAIKSQMPAVRIWGVETEGAASMAAALDAGHVVDLPRVCSVARTLCAPAVAEETLALAQRYLEGVTVVSDESAMEAMRFLLERVKVLAEPASSCTLAAAERLSASFTADSHIVLVLCGGNVSVDDISRGAA